MSVCLAGCLSVYKQASECMHVGMYVCMYACMSCMYVCLNEWMKEWWWLNQWIHAYSTACPAMLLHLQFKSIQSNSIQFPTISALPPEVNWSETAMRRLSFSVRHMCATTLLLARTTSPVIKTCLINPIVSLCITNFHPALHWNAEHGFSNILQYQICIMLE